MSDFTNRRYQLHELTEQFLNTFRVGAQDVLDGMEDAETKFEEQAVVIKSQNETIVALKAENDRIASEYQTKFDLQEQELVALRSQLAEKDKNFFVLARANSSIRIGAQNIAAVAAHALNIVNRDAMGDKIVTQLRVRLDRSERFASGKQEVDPRTPGQPLRSVAE